MKSAIHACLLMAVSAVIACSNDSPTVPLTKQGTGTPITSSLGSITPPPAAEPGPEEGSAKVRFAWEIVALTPTSYSMTVTNLGMPSYVTLASYSGTAGNIAAQTLHRFAVTSLDTGESWTLTVQLPCGQYQVDLFEGRGTPPEPPFFGASLIVGRIGKGLSCSPPPPPPPPVCTEDCEPPPPVCDVKTGNLSVRKPLGNPAEECRVTGDGVPGPPNDWWVMKCGLDYTVSFTKLNHCDESEHELSHATGCACPAPQ